MIDQYFKRPVFWDCIMAIIFGIIGYFLCEKKIIVKPLVEDSILITSDITNISLTMSGFILTLLTVLITFKSGLKSNKIQIDSNESIFDIFFSTGLYHETVRHLKNCIKSILVVAIFGFALKLFCPTTLKSNIFYFNICGLTIIIVTLFRCLLILGKVMDLQKESDNIEQ